MTAVGATAVGVTAVKKNLKSKTTINIGSTIILWWSLFSSSGVNIRVHQEIQCLPYAGFDFSIVYMLAACEEQELFIPQ